MTLGAGFGHLLPIPLHALWGLFLGLLIVLLQCLIFGFFIGSGKTIKKKVLETGLSGEWVEKTKEYKNRAYPSLMLSILAMAAAVAAGGAVAAGFLAPWIHGSLMVLALALNIRSLWISYQTISENVVAIHRINRQVADLGQAGGLTPPGQAQESEKKPVPAPSRNASANLNFLALATWVPYLYMRWSLGDRAFPVWPFILLSLGLITLGIWISRNKGQKS